jgi:hydrogenase expression/formation protein HypC
MCVGVPARVVSVGADHPDLARADIGGRLRSINIGLLVEQVAPGDWLLVHMGFALATMTEREAGEALSVFRDERGAEAGVDTPDGG